MTVFFTDPNPIIGNEGFDSQAQYQMLPAGGGGGAVRRMALVVQPDEPEDVIVFIADPNKAALFGLFAVQGSAAVQGSGFFVKRGSAIRFFLSGRDPGPTRLEVESVSGKPRGFLLISVKRPLRKTYQLGVIRDPIHIPAKDIAGANLANNMLGAEKLWLQQANVVLQRVGPINDVFVPFDLKDPIFIDDPVNVAGIIKATTSSPLFTPADLFIYGTWDIRYRNNTLVGGSNLFNMCFVENQFSGRMGALMCAHEVGHAMGLPHNNGRTDFLMTGSGVNNDFVEMFEIETVNQL
jgi:hypothetical protein